MKLIKPNKLQAGDLVATVSLSWGGAGDPELLCITRNGIIINVWCRVLIGVLEAYMREYLQFLYGAQLLYEML